MNRSTSAGSGSGQIASSNSDDENSAGIQSSNRCTCLYDKRETFKFTIVNYPHRDSNIPLKPAYGVFISQLITYLRVCGNDQHFVYRSVQITTRLQRQWFDYMVLCNKFLQRHPIALRKYQWSHRQMIVDCVCLPLCVFSTKNKHVTIRSVQHTAHISYISFFFPVLLSVVFCSI